MADDSEQRTARAVALWERDEYQDEIRDGFEPWLEGIGWQA